MGEAAGQDTYAAMLSACGYVVQKDAGSNWFEYNGFLRPACLPHCVPSITDAQAAVVLARSKCTFARWDSDFGDAPGSQWWYVLRRGPYSLSQLSGNTRSKIRRGGKRLTARPVEIGELADKGYRVCCSAVERYGKSGFLPSRDAFEQKLSAAQAYPEHLEFFGVFSGEELVGFSENHRQSGGVFWESIWYDPAHLRDYSSYLLTHAMLDHYLNDLGSDYVSDGSRSLYHDTNVQRFFIDKFVFERCEARMHTIYRPWLKALLVGLRPTRGLVDFARARVSLDPLDKLFGLLLQDAIARDATNRAAPSKREARI